MSEEKRFHGKCYDCPDYFHDAVQCEISLESKGQDELCDVEADAEDVLLGKLAAVLIEAKPIMITSDDQAHDWVCALRVARRIFDANYLSEEQVSAVKVEAVKAEKEKIYHWGLERCPHWMGYDTAVFKKDCSRCWQELEEC